jgi:hypothetical protein
MALVTGGAATAQLCISRSRVRFSTYTATIRAHLFPRLVRRPASWLSLHAPATSAPTSGIGDLARGRGHRKVPPTFAGEGRCATSWLARKMPAEKIPGGIVQLAQAMEWYRDRGQHLGGDAAKLTESFAGFATSKAWPDAQRDATVGIYGQVRDQGPAAVMSPAPSAEDDAATITRALAGGGSFWGPDRSPELAQVFLNQAMQLKGVAPSLSTIEAFCS